jgi:hypothetical protein
MRNEDFGQSVGLLEPGTWNLEPGSYGGATDFQSSPAII